LNDLMGTVDLTSDRVGSNISDAAMIPGQGFLPLLGDSFWSARQTQS
jgi:hypothetical protein